MSTPIFIDGTPYGIPVSLLLSQATYSDLNQQFGSPSQGDLVYNHQAVMQGIYNIFRTSPGEAGPIFEPEFGSLIYELLQEPIDEKTAFQIRAATIQALQRWEPRIEINLSKTDVQVDDIQPGYKVTISYYLYENGDSSTTSFLLKPQNNY